MLPIVEARTTHLAFVERESERLDQVQRCTSGEAGPTGIAGVPVDLGVDQRDVDGYGTTFFSINAAAFVISSASRSSAAAIFTISASASTQFFCSIASRAPGIVLTP